MGEHYGPSGPRASLVGRGLDVWEVIATIRDNDGSITETAQDLQVPAGLVEAAATYYGEFRNDIAEPAPIRSTAGWEISKQPRSRSRIAERISNGSQPARESRGTVTGSWSGKWTWRATSSAPSAQR